MRERARSVEDKAQRSRDLLDAAEALAVELGGVRFVTVGGVTERAGLHRTGVRRYYASREELLLELAERGWERWSRAVREAIGSRSSMGPAETAAVLADTLALLPVFCDLLAHVGMSLEGDVDIERARAFKTNSFAAHDAMLDAMEGASTMTREQLRNLIAAAISFAGTFWQLAHPTPTLATLYEQVPQWGHAVLDFSGRLSLMLTATARGLTEEPRVPDRTPTDR